MGSQLPVSAAVVCNVDNRHFSNLQQLWLLREYTFTVCHPPLHAPIPEMGGESVYMCCKYIRQGLQEAITVSLVQVKLKKNTQMSGKCHKEANSTRYFCVFLATFLSMARAIKVYKTKKIWIASSSPHDLLKSNKYHKDITHYCLCLHSFY